MDEHSALMNKAFRVVLMGVEDVAGKNGMATLLRQSNLAQYIGNYPPGDTEYGGHELVFMSRINHALFDLYGPRGARAILQRVGRERWKNALAENATLANATHLALKFLPRRRQVKLALDIASKAYSEQLNTQIEVGEDGECFFWQDLNCGNCMEWQSSVPVCYTMVGFCHGLVAWAIGSEEVKVDEVLCHAKGDDICRFRIMLTG